MILFNKKLSRFVIYLPKVLLHSHFESYWIKIRYSILALYFFSRIYSKYSIGLHDPYYLPWIQWLYVCIYKFTDFLGA